ncbi:DUF2254 domain-containing protein [Rhizobiaceae bacterium]|nr:DUF2254 domain-containing protein [Rhizobiaceae bacterium]
MYNSGIRSIASYLINRLLRGIWLPSVGAMVAAIVLVLLMAWADGHGLSAMVEGWGGVFAFSSTVADDVIGSLATIAVALATLYFSITLIIITLAAQSLGVRLVERWISRADLRATLAVLLGFVVYTTLAGFLAGATSGQVLRGTVLLGLFAALPVLIWLAIAFHRLARMALVDTSIVRLGDDLVAQADAAPRLVSLSSGLGDDAREIVAPATGYLNLSDIDGAVDDLRQQNGRMELPLPSGSFVMKGDIIARIVPDTEEMVAIAADHCSIGRYRTDAESTPFLVSLLVEIACRALSPSMNDFLTAAAAVDQIGRSLEASRKADTAPDERDPWIGDEVGAPRMKVPDVRLLDSAEPYLAALRADARRDRFVTIRLLEVYGRAMQAKGPTHDIETLRTLATDLADEAMERASGADRAVLQQALRRCLGDAANA